MQCGKTSLTQLAIDFTDRPPFSAHLFDQKQYTELMQRGSTSTTDTATSWLPSQYCMWYDPYGAEPSAAAASLLSKGLSDASDDANTAAAPSATAGLLPPHDLSDLSDGRNTAGAPSAAAELPPHDLPDATRSCSVGDTAGAPSSMAAVPPRGLLESSDGTGRCGVGNGESIKKPKNWRRETCDAPKAEHQCRHRMFVNLRLYQQPEKLTAGNLQCAKITRCIDSLTTSGK